MRPELRQALIRRVEELLGDRPLCDRCGATLGTFDERCSEPLDVACPGFLALEAARDLALAEAGR